MKPVDLVLLHPPSVYRFRELPIFHGPISDVIPSSFIFENYPIGFLTLSEYLSRHGMTVRIVNLAMKMLRDFSFDVDGFLAKLHPAAFGIDLHWLPHADGALSLAEAIKRLHPGTPVIFGGLSATYYRQEILRDYPFVDFIVCGDSTEEPLRRRPLVRLEPFPHARSRAAPRGGGRTQSLPHRRSRRPGGRAGIQAG